MGLLYDYQELLTLPFVKVNRGTVEKRPWRSFGQKKRPLRMPQGRRSLTGLCDLIPYILFIVLLNGLFRQSPCLYEKGRAETLPFYLLK